MSMYVPPSTRGQWQSNAYNIFVPRSQSYMAERARERVLTAPDELQAHYRTPHADPDAKPQNYSVHSPQVTGSPFNLAPRSFSGGIDPRALMNPARKINPDLMPVMGNFWVEKMPKSPRRVLNIACNSRGETMQSNGLGTGTQPSSQLGRSTNCGDKNVFSRRAAVVPYSPRTSFGFSPSKSPQNVDVLVMSPPSSASKPARSPRQHQQQADGGSDEPVQFGSTAYHCGSFDPRVPPPMLGRVQPLVTMQVIGGQNGTVTSRNLLLPTLPSAGCPKLKVTLSRSDGKPYGGDWMHRPFACDGNFGSEPRLGKG